MRVGALALVALAAVAALVALGVTDQVLPAGEPRAAELRPWIAARALGVTAYLLLAIQVGLGLVLSHPRNTASWRTTRQVLPWHELVTVFTWAFLALHIVLLAVDPWAKVGWLGALVPGLSEFRTPAVAVGTVATYAMVLTAVTARWTRILPAGWWLRVHRLAALVFLGAWAHGVLAGTDTHALTPLYLATGVPILLGVAHRWWTAKARPRRDEEPATAGASLARPRPAIVTVKES
jgi:hypothetical protein